MDLDYKCHRCDGSGCMTIDDDSEVYQCSGCDGTGKVLTREGRELIEFLQRWSHKFCNEE